MSDITDARLPLVPSDREVLDQLIALPNRPDNTWFLTKFSDVLQLDQVNVTSSSPDRITFETELVQISGNGAQDTTYVGYYGTANTTESLAQAAFYEAATVKRIRVNAYENTYTSGTITLSLRRNGSTISSLSITPGAVGYLNFVVDEDFLLTDLFSLELSYSGSNSSAQLSTYISVEVERATGAPVPTATPTNGLQYIGSDWGLGGILTQDTSIDGDFLFGLSITDATYLDVSSLQFSFVTSGNGTLTAKDLLIGTSDVAGTVILQTPEVLATNALTGQYLRLLDGASGEVDFATIAASEVSYDNSTSGLTATDVQEAIDEIVGLIPPSFSGYDTIQNNGSSLTNRNVLNFDGNYLIASDNVSPARTNVTLSITNLEPALNLANLSGDINLATQVTGILGVANIDVAAIAGSTTFLTSLNLANISGTISLTTQVTGQLGPTNINVVSLAANATFLTNLSANLNLATIAGSINLSTQTTGVLPLAKGGTNAALTDPGFNAIMGWDDTDNAVSFWTIGDGISYDHATHTISSDVSSYVDKLVGVGKAANKTYFNVQVDFVASAWNVANGGALFYAVGSLGAVNSTIRTGSGFNIPSFETSSGVQARKFNRPKKTILEIQAYIDISEMGNCYLGFYANNTVTNPVYGANTIGIGFVRDSSGNMYIRSATGSARTETLITLPSNTPHTYRVEYDPANTIARFYIDGVSVGTITTNLPTSAATDMGINLSNSGASTSFEYAGAPYIAAEI